MWQKLPLTLCCCALSVWAPVQVWSWWAGYGIQLLQAGGKESGYLFGSQRGWCNSIANIHFPQNINKKRVTKIVSQTSCQLATLLLYNKVDYKKKKACIFYFIFLTLRSLLEKIVFRKKIRYGYIESLNNLGVVQLQIDSSASKLNLFDVHWSSLWKKVTFSLFPDLELNITDCSTLARSYVR